MTWTIKTKHLRINKHGCILSNSGLPNTLIETETVICTSVQSDVYVRFRWPPNTKLTFLNFTVYKILCQYVENVVTIAWELPKSELAHFENQISATGLQRCIKYSAFEYKYMYKYPSLKYKYEYKYCFHCKYAITNVRKDWSFSCQTNMYYSYAEKMVSSRFAKSRFAEFHFAESSFA